MFASKTLNINWPVNISQPPTANLWGWGSGWGPRPRPRSGSRPAASRTRARQPVVPRGRAGGRAREGRRAWTALWTLVTAPARQADWELGVTHKEDGQRVKLNMKNTRWLLLSFWRGRCRAGGGRGGGGGTRAWAWVRTWRSSPKPSFVPPSDRRAGGRCRKGASSSLLFSCTTTVLMCGSAVWERQNFVCGEGRLQSGPCIIRGLLRYRRCRVINSTDDGGFNFTCGGLLFALGSSTWVLAVHLRFISSLSNIL